MEIDLEKTNIPSEPLRWSALAAQRETGINRATIQKRLAGANILPGPDGLYSTRDLLKSIHGDIAAEKLRKIELTNEREEIKNAALKRELIPAKEVSKNLNNLTLALRSEILGCADITKDRKDSLLRHLKGVKWTE